MTVTVEQLRKALPRYSDARTPDQIAENFRDVREFIDLVVQYLDGIEGRVEDLENP